MQARLQSRTFLGDQFIYDVVVREKPLVGKSRVMSSQEDGRMSLYVDPADIMVFPAAEREDLADATVMPSGASMNS